MSENKTGETVGIGIAIVMAIVLLVGCFVATCESGKMMVTRGTDVIEAQQETGGSPRVLREFPDGRRIWYQCDALYVPKPEKEK